MPYRVAGVIESALQTGAGQLPVAQTVPTDDDPAALDIGLMVVFAFALIAYPLALKQRALQRSSVLTSYR
jgi:hypothetical protein